MNSSTGKPLAIVTGASSGIGYELAKLAAHNGHDLGVGRTIARTWPGPGWDAVMRGDGDVVSGWQNKLRSAIAPVTPSGVLAEMHRHAAEPGRAKE